MPDAPSIPGCSQIAALLRSRRFSFTTERDLQDALAASFAAAGWAFEREVPLGDAGRIDFLLPARVGVEVKVGGSLAALKRQLFGYAQDAGVSALVLVTSLNRLADLPEHMAGKPLHIVVLPGGLA